MGTPMLPTLDSSRGLLPENNINFGSPWPVSVIFRFASKRIVRDASFPSNQVAQDPPQRKLNFLGQRLVAEKVRPCQWTRHWRCVTPLPWCHGLEKVSATGIGRGGTWSSHRDDRMTSFKRYVCCLRSFLGHQKNTNFILDSRVDPCWSLPFFICPGVQKFRGFTHRVTLLSDYRLL